jgi:SNF2 family DNA or RNA helicase
MMSDFSYNILKSMSKDQLLEIVPDGFKFYTAPWTHQIASFLSCISNDNFLLALDLGTGKTKVSIDVCRYIQKEIAPVNAIVVCLNAAVEKWVEEVQTHSKELSATAVRGYVVRDGGWWEEKSKIIKTAKEVKLEVLCNTDFNFRIISFESLRSCCTKRIKPQDKKKGFDEVHPPAIQEILRSRPNVFIIDESHKIKNKDALIFQIINILSKNVRWRYLLTGTPFHKLLDLWAQYYIMDRGKTFGNSYYRFRRQNFKEKTRFLKKRGIEISDWNVTPEGKNYIMHKMYTKAIRYDESEVHDMPGKVFEVLKYQLSKEQRADYLKIIKGMEDSKVQKTFGENQSMTFRQICSGFIIKANKIYKTNPKLDILESLIDSIVEKDKLVIFHEFNMEYDIISKLLKKKKVKFTMINGRVKDKYSNNKLFLDDDRYRVMVCNIKSGSASIDLQSARYAVFYSNARSVIDRKQAIKRIHRGAVKRTRFYYDLIGKATVEQSMYTSLKDGVDLFDEVMGKKRFLDMMKGQVDGSI